MENVISFLGTGVIIENGAISTAEDFVVQGKVCAKLISTANVILGPAANFEGSIIAHNLEIKGYFKGTALVKENLVIRSGSKVEGNVKAFSLNIESGASFIGESRTISLDIFNKDVNSNKVYMKISGKTAPGITSGKK